MSDNTIDKNELLYIVSYDDAYNKFKSIVNEAVDKLTELAETIISLFPNAEVDSKTYSRLIDRITNAIEYLKEV